MYNIVRLFVEIVVIIVGPLTTDLNAKFLAGLIFIIEYHCTGSI